MAVRGAARRRRRGRRCSTRSVGCWPARPRRGRPCSCPAARRSGRRPGRVEPGSNAAECRAQRQRCQSRACRQRRTRPRVGERNAAPARCRVAGRRRRQVTGAALCGGVGHGDEGGRAPRAEGHHVVPGVEQQGQLAAGVEHHGDVLRRRARQ